MNPFITNTLLFGICLLVFALVRRVTARHPIDTPALTHTIAARSWEKRSLIIFFGCVFLLYYLSGYAVCFFYEDQRPMVQLVTVVSMYGLILLLIALLNKKHKQSWEHAFGMGIRQLRFIRTVPLFYLIALPFMLLATNLSHWLIRWLSGNAIELQEVAQVIAQDLSGIKIAYMLSAILVAPLYEELLFRGILFPLLVKHIGLKGSMIMISLIFAFIHPPISAFVPLFLLSIALCLAYWRTGSLWVSIGLHALFNTINVIALQFMA